MAKVFVSALSFSKLDPGPMQLLESKGHTVQVNDLGRPLTEEEMQEKIADAEALILGVDKVTAKVIESATKLKVIAKHGVGLDNVDVKAATRQGIAVTNALGSNSESVADLTFGLMLAVARKIPQADRGIRQQSWPRLKGPEVWQKTLGIIGLGRIGRGVALRAKGFHMNIMAFDPFADQEFANKEGVLLTDLETLLKESDFVTLNAPLTESTQNLLSRERLELMKKGCYLINTARGELIDEEALLQALQEGWIAGAALDAFLQEPLGNSPFMALDNVVLTPHLGAYSYEAGTNMSRMAAEAVCEILAGQKSDYIVNKEVYLK
ncbi:MAG: phosphoglycerate dehydrogenase [Desulfitobacteriaceae bacterium]